MKKNGVSEKFTEKIVEQIGKLLIEKYLDKRLNEFENRLNEFENVVRIEIQGIRDKVDGISHKVDGLNAKDEAIKYLLDELKRKNGGDKQ